VHSILKAIKKAKTNILLPRIKGGYMRIQHACVSRK
jgi:hypothetical protein